jgi:sirohydrochlorin ferrochelatase
MPPEFPCTLLVDNGSYRAESTLSLRRIAAGLGAEVGHEIHPVSLLHSTRVAPEDLGGTPAEIFEPFVKRQYEEHGVTSFLVVPLFFGHSAAIYEFLPQRLMVLREKFPELELRLAPCLVDLDDPSDTGVAGILAGLVRRKAAEKQLVRPAVTLVDHGTPRIAVNKVRNFLAVQLQTLLRDDASVVVASSMERREGDAYAFNEPLLESLLGSAGFDREVILSMLFMSPGRHAGPGGDIAEICTECEGRHPVLHTHMCDLFARDPEVVPLLGKRFWQGVESRPVRGEVEPPEAVDQQ